jgi:hypothetical protein
MITSNNQTKYYIIDEWGAGILSLSVRNEFGFIKLKSVL